jgi:hypothetical protein
MTDSTNIKAATARKKATTSTSVDHLALAAEACKIYLAKIGKVGDGIEPAGSLHRKTVKGIPLAAASGAWAAALRKGKQSPSSRFYFSVVPHAKTQDGLLSKVKDACKDLPCKIDLCREGTVQATLAYKDRHKVIGKIATTVKAYKV